MGKQTGRTDAAVASTDLAQSANELGLALLIKRAEHVLRARMQALLAAEDLLFEHWQIMAVLLARPGSRMSDVADAALLPPATLTRHMDRLVERALVIRRIDPDDKRSTITALSTRGKALADQLRATEQETAAGLFQVLGEDTYASLLGELNRLA